jgi:hypothetical protein
VSGAIPFFAGIKLEAAFIIGIIISFSNSASVNALLLNPQSKFPLLNYSMGKSKGKSTFQP